MLFIYVQYLRDTVNYPKKQVFILQQIAEFCLYNIQSENLLKKKDMLVKQIFIILVLRILSKLKSMDLTLMAFTNLDVLIFVHFQCVHLLEA